ncbi:MAG: anti-sigma factor domain-containing protein [Acidimicrobiales bacterium]
MDPDMNRQGTGHHEIAELLGAYALDAVHPDEAVAVEAHLEVCPRCRDELGRHLEAVTLLATAGAAAPDDLWARIAANLEEPPPRLELLRLFRPAGRERRSLPARPVMAAAAIAAAVIGVLGVQVQRQDGRLDRLSPAIEARGLDEAVAAALFDDQSKKVELVSDSGTLFAKAVVQPDGKGYLVEHNLPDLPDDSTYQLWGLVGDQTVSLGVLGGEPDVRAFTAAGDVSVLAVTAERAGGVVSPTSDPVVRGFLPA